MKLVNILQLLVMTTMVSSYTPLTQAANDDKATFDSVFMDVYKSESCGCCGNWIEHIKTHNFQSKIIHPADLDGVKADLGIKPQWQSCHTAVSANGYVFEGHIPARYIQQFLAAPPADALGLAVPGMPMGSPGMEVGNQFNSYDILLLNKDGSAEVYAKITSPDQQ